MASVTFIDVCDQLSSMLGADEMEDLPDIDKKRVRINANQAYRECYSPVDGKRPRWATKKISLTFQEDQQIANLDAQVVDIEKYPVLEGHGPLSPMKARTDEVLARSFHGGDFKPAGIYRGRFPSMNMEEPEKDRPIWYFIEQADEEEGSAVIPKMVLYPIPDKEYTVTLYANVIPNYLEFDDQTFRLPADIVWDVLFPIAQGKLLSDPRYNGDNKEIILRASMEAKKRLSSFSSPQKHKNLRISPKPGW